MMDKSAALFRASNVMMMDYPFAGAVAGALQVCEEAVIVVDRNSRDDTLELAYVLQDVHGRDRVTVVEREWRFDRMWQEKVWNWGMEATDAEWLMYHDADEALHEDDVPAVRKLMADPDVSLICFPYLHFYGTPRFVTHAYYPHNTRLGRRSAGYRMRNWCTDERPDRPACEMVWGPEERDAHNYRGPGLVVADVPMYHYGWCRDAGVLANAQARAADWYADGEKYADGPPPSDVDPISFQLGEKLAAGSVERYSGSHPGVMRSWFARHAGQWAELEAGL